MTTPTPPTTLEQRLREIALEEYLTSHSDPEPEGLSLLAREANLSLVHPRMMSGHLQGRLLKMLVRLHKPRKVLELGTYSAYASACIVEGLPPEGRLTTIELFDELEPLIRHNLSSLGIAQQVELIIGDALQLLPTLPLEEYEMIYIDANKRYYCDYLDLIEPRLSPGTLIVADNTLWDSKVIDPNEQDAQTQGIRAFNDRIATSPLYEKVMLPLRDGLTLILHK